MRRAIFAMPFDADATIVVCRVVKTSSRALEVRDTWKLGTAATRRTASCMMRAALTETGVEKLEEVAIMMREQAYR